MIYMNFTYNEYISRFSEILKKNRLSTELSFEACTQAHKFFEHFWRLAFPLNE